ncbi:dihydrofolate reductase family protein [Ornithinimicrobium panacihumi]|uniref:dihydrofolate reductase family protein n=1 Tax=Ornithinimicrobium panacihumi TaxID=2008449 RepID=UPI003F8C949E
MSQCPGIGQPPQHTLHPTHPIPPTSSRPPIRDRDDPAVDQRKTEQAIGKIAANLFTTLDGSAERPDQWHFPYFDDEMGKAVDAHTGRCEAYLMGRGLYDLWSAYWPTAEDDDFKDFINPIQKYVLTTILDAATWDNTDILRDLDQVRQLKERTEGWIGMSGSLTTVRSLLHARLLDELVDSRALPAGALHLTYRPVYEA